MLDIFVCEFLHNFLDFTLNLHVIYMGTILTRRKIAFKILPSLFNEIVQIFTVHFKNS
jgi:hypothetical protein